MRTVFLTASVMLATISLSAAPAPVMSAPVRPPLALDFNSPVDAGLQGAVEAIDQRLRVARGMAVADTAVGVLDLRTGRLALLRPDAIFYAASVPKVAILLAWFATQPDAVTRLDGVTRHELGLMIKVSDNALAAKYSRLIGLGRIQDVLNADGFYDAVHGGGLWMGKHYGQGDERRLDPVGGHSHAATARQLVRFFLKLEQDQLVSPEASAAMRAIFASPEIAHRDDKFVRGLAGREREVRRKAGWWDNWFHDAAVVRGGDRHYILVALTHHARGDDYLEELAAAVDDALKS